MRSLVVVLCVYVVLVPVAAQAEPRRTLEAVALRKRPGEKEPVVARLAAGTEVVVLGIDGRWLRVRAGGVEGYLTRTTVSAPDPGDAAPTGQWSAGWRARGGVDGGPPGKVAIADDPRAAVASEPAAAPPRPIALRADLGIGFRALGMDLTSNTDGGLANYTLDAGAVAATLDVDAALRLRGTLFAAADTRVSVSDSSPGIDYPGPTAPAGKIPFRTVAVDAGVRAGARLRRVFDVALRAGGHYDAFLATSVRNAGMLPRERLLGATLGARVDIAPEASRFTVTARFDALVLGGRAQTAGLEDGTSSTAHALWGGLAMRYALGHRLAAFGGYDFGRATTEWTGMSTRQPGATRTRRVDTAQLVQIGLSASL